MPIEFAPAQPVGAGIAARYGAAQVMQANNPLLLEQQRMAMQYQLQASQIQAGMQAAAQDAAVRRQGIESQRDMQQAALEREGQVTPAQAFAAHAALTQQAQHADLAVWANQQEMTATEAMRLQREKASVGDIMNRDDLTSQEKADAVTMLKTRIDVGSMRLQKTQQKHIQQQMELESQRTQHMKQMDLNAQAIDAKTLDQRTQLIPDPAVYQQVASELDDKLGPIAQDPEFAPFRDQFIKSEVAARGGMVHMYQERSGEWKPLDMSKLAGARGKAGAGGEMDPATAIKWRESHLKEYDSAYEAATRTVERWAKEKKDDGTPLHPELQDDTKFAEARNREMHRRLATGVTDPEKMSQAQPDLETHLQKRMAQMGGNQTGRKPFGGVFDRQPPAAVAGQGGQSAGQQQPQTQAAIAETTRQKVATLDIPPQQRSQVNQMIDRTQELLQKKGGYANLDEDEKFQVDQDRAEIKRILSTAKPAAPAPAPPPLTGPNFAGQMSQGEPSRFQRFTRGDLITTEDLGALGRHIRSARQGIIEANPFRRFAGFR